MRVRLVDALSLVLWLAALVLLIIGDVLHDPTGSDLGRWGIFVAMLALATTVWAIATWVVEVIRLEFEITTLRRLPRSRGSGGA